MFGPRQNPWNGDGKNETKRLQGAVAAEGNDKEEEMAGSGEEKLSAVARNFSPSPIQELSQLAQRRNSINLAEGFPDFPAPPLLKSAAVSAIHSDFNQYRHVQGLCDRVAKKAMDMHGLLVDPLTDIAICCGQTEAFAAAVFSVIDPGDEVILFEPSYETYAGCVSLAGGVPVYVALDPPTWSLDIDKLSSSFTSKTKALVLNSPHNPTGKVFSKDELLLIADACCTNDCLAITDEVYEHITYDNLKHVSLASLPGMQGRTIITSSLSKTFSVTGWRIGWAIAPSSIASAIKNIHVKITDSAPAPLQEAALTALESQPQFFLELRNEYERKRDFLVSILTQVGFQVRFKPQGSFFLLAEIPEKCSLSDVDCVRMLIEEAGVVAVPGRGFFHAGNCTDGLHCAKNVGQMKFIRFAFCKSDDTLAAAATRLREFLQKWGDVGNL